MYVYYGTDNIDYNFNVNKQLMNIVNFLDTTLWKK